MGEICKGLLNPLIPPPGVKSQSLRPDNGEEKLEVCREDQQSMDCWALSENGVPPNSPRSDGL